MSFDNYNRLAARLTQPNHQEVLQQEYLNQQLLLFNRTNGLSNFYIPHETALLLEKKGIVTNPNATDLHPHPANKRLEDHILYEILPHYIKTDITMWFSKPEKALKLLSKMEDPLTITLQNKIITAKDISRYSNLDYVQNKLDEVATNTLVIHDAIHYMSFESIAAIFARNPNLETIYATTVIPAETQYLMDSLHPDIYQIEYRGGTIHYTPDDDQAGTYEQSLSALRWLTHKNVVSPQISYSIEILTSKFAHHLLVLNRGAQPGSDYYHGQSTGYTQIPNYYYLKNTINAAVVPIDILDSMIAYVHSVKTPSLINNTAKLRILLTNKKLRQLGMKKFIVIKEFVTDLIKLNLHVNNIHDLGSDTFFKEISASFKQWLQVLTKGQTNEKIFDAFCAMLDYKEIKCKWLRQIYVLPSHINYSMELPSALNKDVSIQLETFLHNLLDRLPFFEEVVDDINARLRALYEHQIQLRESRPEDENLTDATPSDRTETESLPASELFADTASNITDSDDQIIPTRTVSRCSLYLEDSVGSILGDENSENSLQHFSEPGSSQIMTHPNLSQGAIAAIQSMNQTFAEEENIFAPPPQLTEEEQLQHQQLWAGVADLNDTVMENLEGLTTNSKWSNKSFSLNKILKEVDNVCAIRALYKGLGANCLKDLMLFYLNLPDVEGDVATVVKRKFIAAIEGRPDAFDTFDLMEINRRSPKKFNIRQRRDMTRQYTNIQHDAAEFTLENRNGRHWSFTKQIYVDEAILQEVQAEQNRMVAETSGADPTFSIQQLLQKQYTQEELIAAPYVYFKRAKHFVKNVVEAKNVDMDHVEPGLPSLQEFAKATEQKISNYVPTRERADLYAREMKNGTTGTIARTTPAIAISLDKKVNNSIMQRKVKLVTLIGRGGSRKTRPVVDYLNKKERNINEYTVVTPRTHMRRDWNEMLRTKRKYAVKTFETALLQAPTRFVVFEEADLLPPGYIDTFLFIWTQVQEIIVIFDPIQTTFHEAHPDSVLPSQVTEGDHFLKYSTEYLNYTFRSPQVIARFLGYPSFSTVEGRVTVTTELDAAAKILVPDQVTAKQFGELGHTSYTVGGSQGKTITEKVQLYINNSTRCASEAVLTTALGRATDHFEIVTDVDLGQVNLDLRYAANPFLHALLSGNRFVSAELIPVSAEEMEFFSETDLVQAKLPIQNINALNQRLISKLVDKEEREKMVGENKTNQINSTTQLSQVFLRHQQKDKATFEMTKKKRLRYTPAEILQRKLESGETRRTGGLLWKALVKNLDLTSEGLQFDQELFEECQQEYQKKKLLQKTIKQMENNLQRADPDSPPNSINIFLKGQTVAKYEKMFSEAKAGQTIACFKDEVLVHMGGIATYIQKVFEQIIPERIYIHTKKTPSDLDAWVKKYYSDMEISTTNDYEAFDQSQDHSFLNFQIRCMRYCNIPEEYIEFYKFQKCNALTQFGNLDFMMLTGELLTFFFNTISNLAYTCLRFKELTSKNKDKYPMTLGGDDLTIKGVCTDSDLFIKEKGNYKLVSKLEITDKPIFCGWNLTRQGIYKNPILLYAKLVSSLKAQDVVNKIVSYALDAAFLYKNQAALVEYLTLDEMQYQQALVRIMVKSGISMTKIVHVLCKEKLAISEDFSSATETEEVKSLMEKYTKQFLEHQPLEFTRSEKKKILSYLGPSRKFSFQLSTEQYGNATFKAKIQSKIDEWKKEATGEGLRLLSD